MFSSEWSIVFISSKHVCLHLFKESCNKFKVPAQTLGESKLVEHMIDTRASHKTLFCGKPSSYFNRFFMHDPG